eukprot:COSAG06_NODE_719_length_12828_cov_24.153036_3_plen_481_part_00
MLPVASIGLLLRKRWVVEGGNFSGRPVSAQLPRSTVFSSVQFERSGTAPDSDVLCKSNHCSSDSSENLEGIVPLMEVENARISGAGRCSGGSGGGSAPAAGYHGGAGVGGGQPSGAGAVCCSSDSGVSRVSGWAGVWGEGFPVRVPDQDWGAVAAATTGAANAEHLSVWVGNIPAELANSAAITKIFAEHGCEALFCTPRVKAPPKMSWAVVALKSDAMTAVALTTDMEVHARGSASGGGGGSPGGPVFHLPVASSLGRSGKRWTGFLSHYKDECASPARQMKTELSAELSALGTDAQVYLDSDDLRDLWRLLDAVKESEVLVLMQTRHLLSRPWVLLEIYTAITHAVPIVTVQVQGPACYSFADAQVFLDNFEAELERRNPGAGRLVLNHVQEGHDLSHVGQLLSAVIPFVISKTFTPAASMNVLRAEIADLIIAMDEAVQEGAPVVQEVGGRFQVERTAEYNRRARRLSGVQVASVDV